MKTPQTLRIGIAGLLATALFIPVVSAQNVGIGTTTPQSKLSVDGSSAAGGIAVGDSSYTSTPGTVAPLNGAIIQGYTGIGTTTPGSRLHLQGDGTGAYDSALLINSTANPPTGTSVPTVFLRTSNNSSLNVGDRIGQIFMQSLPGGQFGNNTGFDAIHRGFTGTGGPRTAMRFFTSAGNGGQARMILDENGNVAIGSVSAGTFAPVAPLHVLANTGTVTRSAGEVRNYQHNGIGITTGNPAADVGGVSIYANGRIASGDLMMATYFQAAASYTASDLRMKNIVGASDSAMDLETLKQLRITDYTMKDKSLLGDKRFKKVIAQEVQKVFPQAVSLTEKSIPDVMQAGMAKEIPEGRFQVSLADTTNLKAGEFVEIFDKDRTPHVVRVESVEGNAITVALRSVKEGDEVFVYGRQVDDFGIVDYEALSMLNISATQELAKKFAALEVENAHLRGEIQKVTALEVENAKLKASHAALSALSSEVEALKQAMASLRSKDETTARTVSISR